MLFAVNESCGQRTNYSTQIDHRMLKFPSYNLPTELFPRRPFSGDVSARALQNSNDKVFIRVTAYINMYADDVTA